MGQEVFSIEGVAAVLVHGELKARLKARLKAHAVALAPPSLAHDLELFHTKTVVCPLLFIVEQNQLVAAKQKIPIENNYPTSDKLKNTGRNYLANG